MNTPDAAALHQVHHLLAAGALEDAREALRSATAARLQLAGEHREWGLLAEELGLPGVAEREFNLALRDDPEDRVALEHLMELALERGNIDRALNLLTRRVDLDPNDAALTQRLIDLLVDSGAEPRARALWQRARALGLAVHLSRRDEGAEETEEEDIAGPPPSLVASDADCARFLALFGGREDVYARQWFNPKSGQGGYAPVREPLTPRVLRQHFAGDLTLGVYPIRLDGTCLFCALDIDLHRGVLGEAQRHREVARRVREELASATATAVDRCRALGLRLLVEDSGYKGRHLWFPLTEPLHAGRLVALGRALLAHLTPHMPASCSLEWFPKASRPGAKGLGNLIKLPLGIHRRTGRRSHFLDDAGAPVARPFELLRSHPRLGEDDLTQALAALGERAAAEAAGEGEGLTPPASAPAPQPQPPPVVDAAARPWTAADFERHPAYLRLFKGCAVLRSLRDKATSQRHLSHDEIVVLAHSLGHMPSGVAAYNYLLQLCPGAPAGALLKSPLRGNPVSCPKIRSRIPHITAHVPCNCGFPEAAETYPHPLLHLHGLSSEELAPLPATPPPEAQVRRLLILRHRLGELQREAAALADELTAHLRDSHSPRWELPEGILQLEERDGVPELVWVPKGETS